MKTIKKPHFFDQNPITDYTIDKDENTQRVFPNLQKWVDKNKEKINTDNYSRVTMIREMSKDLAR